MNLKVRNMFRIESKDYISFENFNEIYYVLEQMIEYDVDVPEVAGLQERLPYALQKIATEKLDRNDIITFFPIIWGKFEPYARKVLYILDPIKYSQTRTHSRNSLVDVLKAIGVTVFIQDPKKRTMETEAIFTAYQLRNGEAHECETWSLRDCYDKMAKVITAYLIVTEKALPDLKTVMKAVPNEKRLRILNEKDFKAINVDIFDCRYTQLMFFNLSDFFSHYRRIGGTEYNIDGWRISCSYESSYYRNMSETFYSYERDGQKIIKQKRRTGNSDKTGSADEPYYSLYKYNDESKLVKIERYQIDGINGESMPRSVVDIDYQTDGSIVITHKTITRNLSTIKKPDDKEFDIRINDIRVFDSKGRIIKRGNSSFHYSDDGSIMRIEYPDYSFDEFRLIGNNMYRVHKWRNRDDEVIREKRLYQDGKLKKIIKYREQDCSEKKLGNQEILDVYDFEYFDDTNK